MSERGRSLVTGMQAWFIRNKDVLSTGNSKLGVCLHVYLTEYDGRTNHMREMQHQQCMPISGS